MPDNTTPQVPAQGPHNMSQNMPQQPGAQGKQEINPEKMLLQFLKELEQNVMDLSQRVDVLEQGQQ